MTKPAECLVSKINALKSAIQNELIEYDGSKCLIWLNDCCSNLTVICKYMHDALTRDSDEMDLIFLSLRQLISCVANLERISVIEQKENTVLKICRQHFQERMIHCLSRLNTTIVKGNRTDNALWINESNFVVYMDQALSILAPLALNFDSNQTTDTVATVTEAEFLKSSHQIRESVELLLGQVLAFTCVVLKSDKIALNSLCHRVMRVCLDLQEVCLNDDIDGKKYSESDKRMKAQQLQNVLLNLDRLMNESFLRVFFTTFADFIENPLKTSIGKQERPSLDEMTEKFDGTLDRLIQIGNFGIAYSSNAKAKSNLQSCLASFEAISISLVPSIMSGAFERDTKYFEGIWNETIHEFRRSIQEIINSHALCTVLIDLIHHILDESEKAADVIATPFKSILSHCEILLEHIQLNASELELDHENQLKIRFEDFKMILNECRACVKAFGNIDLKRIKKRFNILLSAIKKMSKAIAIAENLKRNDTQDLIDAEPFTFGHVTAPNDDILNNSQEERNGEQLNESMNVIIDLNEFIERNDVVKKELTQRGSIFYTKQTPRKLPKFSMACPESVSKSTLKRCASNVKRCSKRTSLRIAMFKRQKLLDTRKFIADSISQSSQAMGNDSLNLQITDILEQLSKYTNGSGSE